MREPDEEAGHEEFKHKCRELEGIFKSIGHRGHGEHLTWRTQRTKYCPLVQVVYPVLRGLHTSHAQCLDPGDAHGISDFDTMCPAEAPVHLEDIMAGRAGGYPVRAEGLCVRTDVHDLEIARYEEHVQRDVRVLHVE